MASALQMTERPDGIVVVSLDLPEKKVNTLGSAVLMELADLVKTLAKKEGVRGLLFQSGKPGQFIAGADLNEIGALAHANKAQIEQAMGFGHRIYCAISQLPFPTVALIDGNCMGGGTELTLVFDERVVSKSPATKIALPEVKIGVIPGWGGTQRMPRLIGVHHAIEMITTGEPISAEKAVAVGYAFDAVPAEQLEETGARLIEFLTESGSWRENRRKRAQPMGLSEDQLNFAFGVSEGAVRAKTKGQYPAPLVALKAMKDGVNRTLEDGLKIEQAAALEVMGSPISANLIAIFFMQNRLSRDPGVADPSVKPADVRAVGVLGAGLMGSGIATAHARSGIPTAMVDVDEARIADGLKRAEEVVLSRIRIGRAQPMDLAAMLERLSTSTSVNVFCDRDVVVEAVTENEAVKTEMFAKLKSVLKPGAILASNTSTISITRMASAAPDPARFVGMHFFHPVDRMELVEVIRGEKTSDETVATIVALAKRVRKTPIVVRDCPGFLVNRVLFPYMNEALVLLQEGASMDAIDQAATDFGMPMGPIALQDLVGLDTSAFAGHVLAKAYSDRAVPTPLLFDLVKAGRLGKKSGSGFRKFTGKRGKPEADPAVEPFLASHRVGTKSFEPDELRDRLFLPMLLEATRVLEEKIVREPADVDMGLILGIGFPPFKGGLLRWADGESAAKLLERMGRYQPLGKRYEPTESFKLLAASNGKFYSVPGGR